ncbi:hypothetical protein ACOMHN_020933 [Nucella lapillus]
MLSLLIVSIVAGLCYGQTPSKFSDCSTVQNIASGCATENLDYLKQISPTHYIQMQTLGELDSPMFLMDKLDGICNDTMKLNRYFMCSFSNVSTCLKNANSTMQLMQVPDPSSISMGIVDMCNRRSELNKTCVMSKMGKEVAQCIGGMVGDKNQMQQCMMFEGLLKCIESLTACKGGDVMKDYMISARPRVCSYNNSAQQYLPSVLLLVGLLLSHFVNLQ